MGNHASAEKKNRADVQCNLRNRRHLTKLRSQVKKFRQAIASGRPTILEVMVSRELGEPFRRDALRTPVRLLPKYRAFGD